MVPDETRAVPVTPYGGVWIEITEEGVAHGKTESRLMGACGLKYILFQYFMSATNVTPYGGVWIEIIVSSSVSPQPDVMPYGGVWIEIFRQWKNSEPTRSRLMETCGSKWKLDCPWTSLGWSRLIGACRFSFQLQAAFYLTTSTQLSRPYLTNYSPFQKPKPARLQITSGAQRAFFLLYIFF